MKLINIPSLLEVQKKLSTALRSLYKNDLLLIKNSTHERSITHKLAEYIQIVYALDYFSVKIYILTNKTRHGILSGTAPGRVVFLLPSGGKTNA